MKSNTAHHFRFRMNRPRQTYFHSDGPKNTSQDESAQPSSKGFSSEYINLARRFNINILHDHSLSPLVNLSKDRDKSPKVQPFRVKTQFSRANHRQKSEGPFLLPSKPQSLSVHYKSPSVTNRSSKPSFFRYNHNTVYDETLVRMPSESKEVYPPTPETVCMHINEKDNTLMHLGNHSKKLLTIKQSLQKPEVIEQQVIRNIKLYILREEGSSIAHLDSSFSSHSKDIKKLVILERITLVSIISNIVTDHLQDHLEQTVRCIEIILGFWYQVLTNTYQNNLYKLEIQLQSDIKIIISKLQAAKLMTKANITLLLETTLLKTSLLLKHNPHLHNRIAFLVSMSEQLSINRAFYELLTHFARYLTELEKKVNINIDVVSFFATCPSPYLLKPPRKPYSLVIDLDQTLLYSKMNSNNKLQTVYRPDCIPFIEELYKHYQIIIFTTSLQNYAKEVTAPFKNLDHLLCRQHAVRVKNGFVKDLNRLGRDLNKVIIVDDLPQNFKLQKQNGIRVKAWRGDQKDEELQKLKSILIQMASRQSKDIKQLLPIVRERMKETQSTLKLQAVPSQQ